MLYKYNAAEMKQLIDFIEKYDGIADKKSLSEKVQNEFSLVKYGKVFSCEDYSVRFCKAKGKNNGNTVLALSKLMKFDDKPFLVCFVASDKNYLYLANTTFLKKISHSSAKLRLDNIRGSFNAPDMMMEYDGIENCPENFERLFAYHAGFTLQDNLERLVEETNGIVGRNQKFTVMDSQKERIMESISRAVSFVGSEEFRNLKKDLDDRVAGVQSEIAIAAFIDNVNIRGRLIEYLITSDSSDLKTKVIKALHTQKPLPGFKTEDKLGDYSKDYPRYHVEIDIKTKVLFLDGNPKAYNIDKLLRFLDTPDAVYMIYLLGVDENGNVVTRLCSCLDSRLIEATRIQEHWSGRNTRGVTQFIGRDLKEILEAPDQPEIDPNTAKTFLDKLILC